MATSKEQFFADYDRVKSGNIKGRSNSALSDKEQFFADYDRIKKAGQTTTKYTAETVAPVKNTTPQQSNFNQMQQLLNKSTTDYEKELKAVNDQIAAIGGYGVGADRSNMSQLYKTKDELEQKLGVGRYDTDLTALERVQLAGQYIGESTDATAGVLADIAGQAVKDFRANKSNADYQRIKDREDEIGAQINLLEQRAAQGVADATMLNQLQLLYKEKQYLQNTVDEKYKTPLNLESDSMQAMQRALQAREQATYGMSDTAAGVANWAISMADSASRMPLSFIPGVGNAISSGIMAARVAAEKAYEVGAKGGTAAEALTRGAVSGGIEYFAEKYGLDNLTDIVKSKAGRTFIKDFFENATKSLPDAIKAVGKLAAISHKQGKAEMGEEFVSYVLNYLADEMANDPEAKFSIEDAAASAFGGYVSGYVFGSLGQGVDYVASKSGKNRATNEDVRENRTTDNNFVENNRKNVAETAESAINSTESAINSTKIDSTGAINAKNDRKSLENKVKEIVGIDTRTESEKVADKENARVAAAEEMAAIVGASEADVERVRQSAAENIAEAKAKESLDNAVELIEYAGKEADIYSDIKDNAVAYNTAKRIGINLAHTNTTAMGRAVHEVGHDKTQNAQWANYTAAIDRLVATDGRLAKLMEDIKYSYENSPDADIRASVSFEDGTINNAKVREEQYLKLTEIMLPNIAKGDKQLLDAIKKDRNVIDNLLDFIRGIKNKVSIKLTRSEAAMLDEAERQLVNLLRSESQTSADGVKQYSYGDDVNVENTEIDDNPSTHTPEELKIIEEFKNSVDYELVDYIQKARTDEYVGRYKITETTARAEQAMKDLTKLPKVGKYMVINKNTIQHIDYGHGKLGESDSTMSNDEDIARIKYVLDNFDNAYLSKKDTKATKLKNGYNAPMVLFEKKVDGHYVIVEAVTDASTNNNLIISAFFSKNGIDQTQIKEEWQVSKAESDKTQSADFTAKPLPSYSSNTKISQTKENINGNNLLKEKQLEIVIKANPMTDDYHTGIRSVADILTAEEAFAEENFGGTPDWTQADADKALSKGKVTVYSSYPIENGVFVTPSKIEAQSYAGGGKVYSKTVDLKDVAWIDSEQGQYAATEDTSYSLQSDIDTNEYWGENSKSRAVERHAVNEFATAVADLMGVEFNDKNDKLKKQAWRIADIAKKTGVFDVHQMIDFFNFAYDIGKQEIGNVDERNAALKKKLHDLGIKPLKGREYTDFVQKYRNKIRFTNKGSDIDIVYNELVENYPEWFSEDIVNPYDMMHRIGEVYDSIQGKKVFNKEFFGKDAEQFKNLAMEMYQKYVDNFIDTMNSVSRYQLALAEQKKQDEATAKKVYTLEDVKTAREHAQALMKEIAKMDRKNLFTAEDRNRLNGLLELKHPADIERMQESLRATNPLAEDIIAMYEKKKMLEAVKKPIYEYNKQRKARLKSQFLDILQTSDSWKDKGSGLAYMNNTFERNIDDIVTDKKAAEKLKDILPRQIHKHVADATRYKNKLRDKIRGFDINTTKTYNIEVQAAGELLKGEATEADLIQMYGEGIVTKQYLDKIGANTKKIVETADKFREIYNELFEKINEAYVTNGYAPMEYRQDYFPHFFDETGDTLLNKVGQFLGFDAKNMLPTEIAGRTHEFSPGRQWNSHALQRKGEKTDYNVLKGFDNYIEAAANIIHLTEDIQNLRAFENAIRYKYSDEGMKAELDAIDALPISEAEKQEQRERILKTENRNTRLNNFVVWEHEYTNLLAGKKSKADRWIEDMFGRRFYTVAKNIENRVSANMIAGNISSALTNFIPLTQLTAEVDGRYIFAAMSDTIKNMKENDGIVEMSDFLTNRFGSEMLSLTTMQKLANKAGAPMALVDEFTSNVVTRARYLQNVDKGGMDSVSAMREADEYAASLMADRSKGALPTIFESKNPIIKMFTMFQVEQANQLNYLFKDLPRKNQEKAKSWFLWALIKLGVFSFLYNWMFEQLAGRKPAFSPVDMIYDTGKDVAKVAKGDMKASAALSASFVRTMENMPYASSALAVTGLSENAGRIPVSGALPDFSQISKVFDRDVDWQRKRAVLWKELTKPVYYVAAPFAGGAAKKIVDTAELYGKNKGVQYSVQSDGSKKVQFASEPTVANIAKGAVFGKWSSKEAQEYIDSGFKGLSKNQTKAFEELKGTGLKNKEATAIVKSVKEADTNKSNGYTQEEAKKWLNSKNFTREQKAILFALMCPTAKNNPYK